MGNVLAFSRGQEPFIGIDDIRSFIDLAEPVKVVSGSAAKMVEPDISAQSVSAINDFFIESPFKTAGMSLDVNKICTYYNNGRRVLSQ